VIFYRKDLQRSSGAIEAAMVRMAASALLALIVPIICNGSPNRSCQRFPSAFKGPAQIGCKNIL
jgi:hypothetical protein